MPSPNSVQSRVGSPDAYLAEADHRITNNLTLIVGLLRIHSRHLSRGEGPIARKDVKLLIDDVAGRIQTVARLHHLLARAGHAESLELGRYLPDVCNSVTSSLTYKGCVELKFNMARDCNVSPEAAVSLGLIVCELLTNSVKYAHPTGLPVIVTIDCKRDDAGNLVIHYSDDGVGLPEGFDPAVDGGIGFLLVRNRAEQLRAQHRFEHDGLGLRFRLVMPAAMSE